MLKKKPQQTASELFGYICKHFNVTKKVLFPNLISLPTRKDYSLKICVKRTSCFSLFLLQYLFFAVIILLLELPVDYGTLRLWTALKKSAAVLYSIDNLFLQGLTTWVICKAKKKKN